MTIIEFTEHQGRLLLQCQRFELVMQRMDCFGPDDKAAYDRLTTLIGILDAMIANLRADA